jgi:hypothetical protein
MKKPPVTMLSVSSQFSQKKLVLRSTVSQAESSLEIQRGSFSNERYDSEDDIGDDVEGDSLVDEEDSDRKGQLPKVGSFYGMPGMAMTILAPY